MDLDLRGGIARELRVLILLAEEASLGQEGNLAEAGLGREVFA